MIKPAGSFPSAPAQVPESTDVSAGAINTTSTKDVPSSPETAGSPAKASSTGATVAEAKLGADARKAELHAKVPTDVDGKAAEAVKKQIEKLTEESHALDLEGMMMRLGWILARDRDRDSE